MLRASVWERTSIIQTQLLTMGTLPAGIRTTFPPQIRIVWTIAQPICSTVVPTRFVADVDAAAHTRLGTGVAGLVRYATGTVLCDIGAILEIACRGRERGEMRQ